MKVMGLCDKLYLSYRKEITLLKKMVKDESCPKNLKLFLEKRFDDF